MASSSPSDPRMTPTNDASVTVEQCDRDGCADFELMVGRINEGDAARIRAGEWDETRDVLWFARHRLAALASAPEQHSANGEVQKGEVTIAEREARRHGADSFDGKEFASAPAGDGIPSTAEVAEAIRIAREQADKVYGVRWMALEEIIRHELVAAALARPRAAVGERMEALVRSICNATSKYDILGADLEAARSILAELQCPPAKVEE